VNLRGSQATENDTLGAASTEFLANLQFAGVSGSFIVLGSGRGPIIRDLIIDGNALSSTILNIAASDSLIDYCTIRNASLTSGTAINFKGTGTGNTVNNCTVYNCQNGIVSSASQTYGKIVDSNILACVNGISLGNGLGWIVAQNSTFQINAADISVSGSGYKIIDNVLNDISGIGITIANSAIQGTDVSGNTISAITHSTVIGIQITSSVANFVNCAKNVLYMLSSLTGCTGIKTVNDGAIIPGDIFDNQITNFNIPYDVGDGYSTGQRSQDSNGLKVYKQVIGNDSLESAYDKANSQQVVINPNDIGSSIGVGQPITSIGGRVSNVTVYNRRHLTKYGAGAGYVGARLHDALELDDTNTTPRTDTRAWYERDFNDGSHHWGDMATENMSLDVNGILTIPTLQATKSLIFGGNTVDLSVKTFGVAIPTTYLTEQISANITYQVFNKVATIFLPGIGGTSNSNTLRIVPNETRFSTTSNSITTGIKTFSIDPALSFPSIGQTIKISYTSTPTNYMTGVVTSYNSANGELGVSIDVVVLPSGAGPYSGWSVSFTSFPFVPMSSLLTDTFVPCLIQDSNFTLVGIFDFQPTYWNFASPRVSGHMGYVDFNTSGAKGVYTQTLSILIA
jgi:hypothetical protein